MAQSPNRILNALPQNIFAALQSHLTRVDLIFGSVVAEPGETIKRVYFPHEGVISLVVELEGGDMVETAMIGRDGVANGTSALDSKISAYKGIIQVAGSASAINPDTLRAIAKEFEPLRSILIHYEQMLFAEAQQTAACNASHSLEERMGRWLLRTRDLTESDEMPLTQDFLAHMLGVRRTSVTLVARAAKQAGLISYQRGKIKIADVEGLQRTACECYDTVRSNYARLFAHEPMSPPTQSWLPRAPFASQE